MLLKDCATIKGGKRLPKGQTLQGEKNSHPYIRVKDMQKRYVSLSDDYEYVPDNIFSSINRYIVNTGDVILSIVGTVGLVAIVDKSLNNANLTENCVKLVNIKNFLSKYVYYYLISESGQAQIQAGIVGSTQPKFPLYNIEKIEIPDISWDEQQHIVDILGTLDDKIENNSKKAEEYEKMIELYFEQLLSEKTNEWNEQSLLDIAEYTNGLAMQKFRPRGIDYLPVVKIKELSQGCTDSNSEQADVAIGNKFIIDDGDIVFAWSGTLMVKIWCGGKAGLNQHLFKVTSEKYPKWFVYLWTKHHLIKFQNIAKGKAVTMGHIKRDDLAKSSAFIPPSNTFAQYDRIIAPIYERIVILQQENRKLMSLKSQYLQRFFG